MPGEEQNQPPLAFDTWANLSAIESDVERDGKLAELGLSASWPQADNHWSAQLAHDILQGRTERVRRYAQQLAQQPPTSRQLAQIPGHGAAAGQTPHGTSAQPLSARSQLTQTAVPQVSDETSVPPAAAPHASEASLEASSVRLAETIDQPPALAQAVANAVSYAQTPSFAASLAGNDAPLQRPEPGQQHTVFTHHTPALREEMRAAEAAASWTVDQYACFRAELHAAGAHASAVYARYGLHSTDTQEIVTDAWTRRLSEDAAQRARFETVLNEQKRLRGG